MLSILINVNITVESIEDARDIADDLSEILNDNGIINSINVTDEISE